MTEIGDELRFLRESFPLISTYLYSEAVSLFERQVGVTDDAQQQEFAGMVRIRHAIACAKRLLPILQSIESSPSTNSVLERAVSRGAIRGRLDIPAYLTRRVGSPSWPRTYPVTVNRKTLDTPENLLASTAIIQMIGVLSSARLPAKTAERRECDALVRILHARSRSVPWREISGRENISRLYVETRNRLQRRQTGNDDAYIDLCHWVSEWKAFPDAQNGFQEMCIGGLVAFPTGDFFYERIFEIWVLQQSAETLGALGATLTAGPRPLQVRLKQPIYEFSWLGKSVEVWFQRPLTSSSATWKYRHSNESLRGTPDVMLVCNGYSPMLIDAKYRLAKSRTRAEESYKMLGYLENFRSSLESPAYHSCLVFLSMDGLNTVLDGWDDRGHLTLLGAHPKDADECLLAGDLRIVVAAWLAGVKSEIGITCTGVYVS